MKVLSHADYQILIRDAQVLSRDKHGDKVLQRPDGRIIKLFRRKRWFSSALIFPYAARFERASRRLQALGIRSVIVEQSGRVPAISRHFVVYPMLAGASLREVLARETHRRDPLLLQLARFLAKLHGSGVYFRAIHFGNVLVCDDAGELALIDISEARFGRGPLSIRQRSRNFKPLVTYAEDRAAIAGFGAERFVSSYLEAVNAPAEWQTRFRAGLPGSFGPVA